MEEVAIGHVSLVGIPFFSLTLGYHEVNSIYPTPIPFFHDFFWSGTNMNTVESIGHGERLLSKEAPPSLKSFPLVLVTATKTPTYRIGKYVGQKFL